MKWPTLRKLWRSKKVPSTAHNICPMQMFHQSPWPEHMVTLGTQAYLRVRTYTHICTGTQTHMRTCTLTACARKLNLHVMQTSLQWCTARPSHHACAMSAQGWDLPASLHYATLLVTRGPKHSRIHTEASLTSSPWCLLHPRAQRLPQGHHAA